MMKIDTKMFVDWMKKATANSGVGEAKIEFGEEGVKISMPDTSNTYLVYGFLKKSAFKTYEVLGTIGVPDTARLLSFLDRFDGELTISKKDVVLVFEGQGRKAEYVLSDEASVPAGKEMPEYKGDGVTFKVDANVFNNVIKNAKSVGNDTDIVFTTEAGKLNIQTGKDDKFVEQLNIQEIQKEGIFVKFKDPLKKVVPVLEGEIEVTLATNYPILISMVTDNMDVKYFVTPKIEEEE